MSIHQSNRKPEKTYSNNQINDPHWWPTEQIIEDMLNEWERGNVVREEGEEIGEGEEGEWGGLREGLGVGWVSKVEEILGYSGGDL